MAEASESQNMMTDPHQMSLCLCSVYSAPEPEAVPGPQEEAPPAEESAAGLPSGRRNPPGGKSSLILGWIPTNYPS